MLMILILPKTNANDGMLYCGHRSVEYFGAAAGGGYLCSDPISTYYIFSTYDSISTWYIDDTKAAG